MRWIVEELLFRHALAFPSLTGKLFHASRCSVEPRELEDPADNDVIAIQETRAYTFRPHGLGAGKDITFVGNVQLAANAGSALILLHGCEFCSTLAMKRSSVSGPGMY